MMKKFLAISLFFLAIGVFALNHHGEIDTGKCHTDKETGVYHCH